MGLRNWLQSLKAKIDAAALKLEEERRAEAMLAEQRAKWAIEDAKGADTRLQEHYDALQDGKITLEDYKAQIELELDLAKIEIESLRSMRRDMDRDDYEDQREKADEDLEAARWRLSWVKQQIREQGNKPDWMGKSGKWASFEYADSDGVLTKQHITMWKAYGDEVRGWDRKLKAEVGFAYDQIHGWQAG